MFATRLVLNHAFFASIGFANFTASEFGGMLLVISRAFKFETAYETVSFMPEVERLSLNISFISIPSSGIRFGETEEGFLKGRLSYPYTLANSSMRS